MTVVQEKYTQLYGSLNGDTTSRLQAAGVICAAKYQQVLSTRARVLREYPAMLRLDSTIAAVIRTVQHITDKSDAEITDCVTSTTADLRTLGAMGAALGVSVYPTYLIGLLRGDTLVGSVVEGCSTARVERAIAAIGPGQAPHPAER